MSEHFIRATNNLGLVDQHFTPFYRFSTNIPRKKHFENFIAPYKSGNIPITVQIMGTDPEILGEGAANFVKVGASAIDLNLGCPSRQVTSGGAGGGALKELNKLPKMLKIIKSYIPNTPLSVKTRTGWESFSEFDKILDTLLSSEVLSQITVHYRTVSELYLPVKDRKRRFSKIMDLTRGKIPVILNGDFSKSSEISNIIQLLNPAGIMVARGFLSNPFIFKRIKNEKTPELSVGRDVFFKEVIKEAEKWEGGLKRGAAIELSNFIWGKNNPYFQHLLKCEELILINNLKDSVK